MGPPRYERGKQVRTRSDSAAKAPTGVVVLISLVLVFTFEQDPENFEKMAALARAAAWPSKVVSASKHTFCGQFDPWESPR